MEAVMGVICITNVEVEAAAGDTRLGWAGRSLMFPNSAKSALATLSALLTSLSPLYKLSTLRILGRDAFRKRQKL